MADLFEALFLTFLVLGSPGFIWLIVSHIRKKRKYLPTEALVLDKSSYLRSSTNSEGKTTTSRVFVYKLEFEDVFGVVRNSRVEKSTGKFEVFAKIGIWYDPHFPTRYVRICKGYSFYVGPVLAMLPYAILAVVLIKSFLAGTLSVG